MWRAARRLARVNLKMAESEVSVVSSVSNTLVSGDIVQVSNNDDTVVGSTDRGTIVGHEFPLFTLAVNSVICKPEMSEPTLVEESTPFRLSANLENIAKTLGEDAVHHDYAMALVIVLMTEAGFSVVTDNDQGWSKKSPTIPDDWRSEVTGNYTLRFFLDPVPHRKCKIVAIPSGDTLILNLLLENEEKRVFSKAVQTAKYVNIYSSDISGRYLNLREFSFGFKNALSTPARGEILSSVGLTNPSLRGLPAEMKIRILGMLDVHSIGRIARISKEFWELSREPIIWRRLLFKDFEGLGPDDVFDDYYKEYKERYSRRRDAARRRASSFHRLDDWNVE